MIQKDTHMFVGMKRDSHPIKQKNEYLWDAHNIRLTSMDGSTLMSVTNEKSTEQRLDFGAKKYIGHCLCGKYLVMFLKGNKDCIVRVDLDSMEQVALYEGDLNFDTQYPILAFSDRESELIQKVYWIDGNNRPRVINIMKKELTGKDSYNDAPFDFVQDLELNERVIVKRLKNSTGIFSPGVIQYAFTYYFKYGLESNIFYVTEPLYVAHPDRGGDPDKTVSTSFLIEVSDCDKRFDYLRIYSILRSTKDAVPMVKRVADLPINNMDTVRFTDNNTQGDAVDPAKLLYIGGKDIVAGCIHPKDGVLFMGDIRYNRHEARILKIGDKIVEDVVKDIAVKSTTDSRIISYIQTIPKPDWDPNNSEGYPYEKSSSYSYINLLSSNSQTFKVNEIYRLGLQFQYKNGEWSEPIFIKDRAMEPDVAGESLHQSINYGNFKYKGDRWESDITISSPVFKADIKSLKALIDSGYVKVRPLIAYPEMKDRKILALGILCPTVFNAYERSKSSPYAKSSWLLRPYLGSSMPSNLDCLDFTQGVHVQYQHELPLLVGKDRGAEIQNMYIETNGLDGRGYTDEEPDLSLSTVQGAIAENKPYYNSVYYVDLSVLTFHSPDIDFGDGMKVLLSDSTNLKIRIVGIVPFSSNYGDIDIQTSSANISGEARGYIHSSSSGDGSRSLVSGLFYEDSYVDSDEDNSVYEKSGYPRGWMTYMWHRSGSLNNDVPRAAGSRTAELRRKVISNIKYSDDNLWFPLGSMKNLNIGGLQLVANTEKGLSRLKNITVQLGTGKSIKDLDYYGNVDVLNPSNCEYRLVHSVLSGYSLNTLFPVEVKGLTKINITDSTSLISSTMVSVQFTALFIGGSDSAIGSDFNGELVGEVISDSTIDNTNIKGWKVIALIGNILGSPKNLVTFAELKVLKNDSMTPLSFIITHASGSGYIKSESGFTAPFNFNDGVTYIKKHEDRKDDVVGTYVTTLRSAKDPVRIKYKSTPHMVFANLTSGSVLAALDYSDGTNLFGNPENFKPFLYLAELYRDVTNPYGTDLEENLWIPAGDAIRLDGQLQDGELILKWTRGDTWYQRYDCIKTYPFSDEDENQVVEIGSFMVETRINIDGRYDRNRGLKSNLDMSPKNFNLINPVYSQLDTFFNYRLLDKDFYKVNSYPSLLMWTLAKTPAAEQDLWTNLHMANSLDLDGTKGRVSAIASMNENLYAFLEMATNKVQFNTRVQIQASDGVPIEIANSGRVDGTITISSSVGCQDKFGVKEASSGLYFIDNNNSAIFRIGESLENISNALGTLYWLRESVSDMTWRFSPDKEGRNGIRVDYDPKHGDIYFIPGADKTGIRDALCYSEVMQGFISFYSYGGAVMFPYGSKFYSLANEGNNLKLWENFPKDGTSYNRIFNKTVNYSLSFISNDNPNIAKIFDNVELRADSYINGNIVLEKNGYSERNALKKFTSRPFDYIQASNEYQDTGKIPLNTLNFRKKFREWRAVIPRQKNTRSRIMNPWCMITLGSDNPDDRYTILHDLSVFYTI